MKRNRSIRTLPLDNLNLLKHPLPEPSQSYFGEEVKRESSPVFERTHILSSDDSDLILKSIKDWGNSKSSSSSLSWGEEYKSEASKQVRDELERMDRVLRGEEPIPSHYDEEEYREWMEFFPQLCVLGTKIGTYTNSNTPVPYFEETFAIDPPESPKCDCVDEHTKKTVIDQICAPKITLNDSIDVDSFLKISPLGGASRLSRRQSSSKSLISSQISSAKWLKDEDYSSLPFLGVKSGNNRAPKSILKNSLVLPPIETRSVSSTPRRESKSLSALGLRKKFVCK